MAQPEGSFGELIPELREWNGGAGIDVDSWIACVGNWEHAIGYGRLFWPDFIEHDGCIFRATMFDAPRYAQWRETLKGDRHGIQAVMNHLHVADMFGDTSLTPTVAQIIFVGRMLKDIWAAKLARDYPGMEIAVTFQEDGSRDPRDYELTFWRVPGKQV